MKTTYRKRIIGFVCAAAVLCSNAAGMAPVFPAAAYAPLTNVLSEDDTALTPVIITLDGSTALDCAQDPEDLDLPAAKSASERAVRQQERVIKKLREKYPALETDHQFATIVNGFSCELPNTLIPYAESLKGVKDVTVSRKIEIKPELVTAPALGEIPAYYDETGCKGEGQVIAIIDTELNLEHPMFSELPDDVNIKLTKDDIEEIANTVGFNCKSNWRNGYYNNKIPFAVDYSENPFDVENEHRSKYHGSHVAGIAAGNSYETDDGKQISGIAPNAQIVFMALDDQLSPEMFVAAIEDAVKLHADVINLSMGIDGEYFDQFQILTDAINAAESAGITFCISAGNADTGSMYYGDKQSADNPDRSCMNGFIQEGSHALAVASADNLFTTEMHTLTHNGVLMPYSGCASSSNDQEQYLGDQLSGQELEYEYCGLGFPEDFERKDLTGKLALVDRGELSFEEKANNAMAVGAVGVIVIQNVPFDNMLMLNNSDILLAMVSQEDGAILKDAEVKTVSFTDEKIPYTMPLGVSSYSSWGVHNSLELRPDIMGIGANVKSAKHVGEGISLMSGTSMASPYLAGCAVILNEYLDKTECALTGSERQKLIRNLLMTAAAPLREDGICVTPRRQGAGLVSMNNTVHDKVLLTGKEGESKLNLRDELGSQFSFPVTATNISNEDVTFSSARIELTTDDTEYDADEGTYILTNGQQALSCTADLSELTVIPAGSSKTVDVTVTLDAAQAASLSAIFTNGYFIEGYLMLEGAENCCDISVPMLGYSECYADLPLFSDSCKTALSRDKYSALIYSPSYFDLAKKKMEIDWPVFPGGADITDIEQMTKLLDYYKVLYALLDSLQNYNETIIISPNHDHVADDPGIIVRANHACIVSGAELYAKDGSRAAVGFDAVPCFRNAEGEYGLCCYPNQLLYDLPEGEYTMRLTAAMTEEALQTHPQILEAKVIIDKTDPELKTELTELNGRKILKLTAKDDRLDSLAVLGIGSGAPLDPSAYERLGGDGIKPAKNFVDHMLAPREHFFSYYNTAYYSSEDDFDEYCSDEFRYDPAYLERLETASPLMRLLEDEGDVSGSDWINQYDYSEIIKAVPDENGVFTIEYDVTDMEAYHFVIMDNGLNSNCVDYYSEMIFPSKMPSGIYKGLHGLYEFTEDTLCFYPFAYGILPTTYHYSFEMQGITIDDISLVLDGDFENSLNKDGDTFRYKRMSETEIELHGTDEGRGFLKSFGFPDTVFEHLELTDLTSAADYFADDTYTHENSYIIPFMKDYMERGVVRVIDYEIEPDAVVTYTCIGNNFGGGGAVTKKITVDLKTGIGTLEDGSTVDLINYTMINPGDVNEDSMLDVADAVILARVLAEDTEVTVTEQGKKNADCNRNGQPDQQDVVLILKAIARLVKL